MLLMPPLPRQLHLRAHGETARAVVGVLHHHGELAAVFQCDRVARDRSEVYDRLDRAGGCRPTVGKRLVPGQEANLLRANGKRLGRPGQTKPATNAVAGCS